MLDNPSSAIDAFEDGPNIIHVHGDNFHTRGAIDVLVHISAVSRQLAPARPLQPTRSSFRVSCRTNTRACANVAAPPQGRAPQLIAAARGASDRSDRYPYVGADALRTFACGSDESTTSRVSTIRRPEPPRMGSHWSPAPSCCTASSQRRRAAIHPYIAP